jgi:uncharacterized protein
VNTTVNVPWKRYALIAELAKRLNGICPQFGKTALQKLVFLLQEVYRIDCGYDFQLYSYGPFDAQLLSDLDLVEAWNCVSVQPVMAGYEIHPTAKVDSLHEKAADFFENPDTEKALCSLISDYGTMTARELELRATTVYVSQDLGKKQTPLTKELLELVKKIKPKFFESEIVDAIEELKDKDHIYVSD